MPRTSHKTLSFPSGGVVRRESYRKQTKPYSAPWAVNVRAVETMEDRMRGGSRPGLVEVSGVTKTTEGIWLWEDETPIQWEDESNITYDLVVDLVEAADGSKIINPAAIIDTVSGTGDAPTSYTISCYYRDRVIIGKGRLWYASRMGDHDDWDYGADKDDSGRAVAGTVDFAGQTDGLDITAIIPYRDKALIIATPNTLHVFEGDLVTGSLKMLDDDIGIIAPYGWAFNGETLAFLSNDGVYVATIGSKPERFSEGRIPGELRNVDDASNTITMAYDPTSRGFYLFITPASGTGSHYYLDLKNKAIWPIMFGDDGHQPVIAARIRGDALERVMLKGRDGTWREFSDSATDDDGTTLESHVLIGPIRIAGGDTHDAILAELHGIMGDVGTSAVTWRVVLADSAEEASDAAVTDLNSVIAGGSVSNVVASGSWSGGRNSVNRPRARGMWLVVWISSETQWAYEAVATVARQFGRTR